VNLRFCLVFVFLLLIEFEDRGNNESHNSQGLHKYLCF